MVKGNAWMATQRNVQHERVANVTHVRFVHGPKQHDDREHGQNPHIQLQSQAFHEPLILGTNDRSTILELQRFSIGSNGPIGGIRARTSLDMYCCL